MSSRRRVDDFRAGQSLLPFSSGGVGGRVRLRSRRRRARLLFTFFGLLVVTLAVGGFAYATYIPRLQITAIDVSGADSLSSNLIRNYAETILNDGKLHVLSRTNLFLYPRTAIAHALAANFPRIARADVNRESLLAQAVRITIHERQPSATWCSDTRKCYQVDTGGFIFAEAATTSGYEFRGGLATTTSPIGSTYLPGHFTQVDVLLKLFAETYAPVSIDVVSDHDYTVRLQSGLTLYIPFDARPEEIVRNLDTVLASDTLKGKSAKLDHIDLRFGNRVYYKLKK